MWLIYKVDKSRYPKKLQEVRYLTDILPILGIPVEDANNYSYDYSPSEQMPLSTPSEACFKITLEYTDIVIGYFVRIHDMYSHRYPGEEVG